MEWAQNRFMDLGLLWLRIMIGLGIARHGAPKVFGGIEKVYPMIEKLGFPMPHLFAWMSALAEFGCGILILLGLGTRFAAFILFFNMSVAAFIALGGAPLSMPGKELALLYWTIAITLMLTGAGRYSVDHMISSRLNSNSLLKKLFL